MTNDRMKALLVFTDGDGIQHEMFVDAADETDVSARQIGFEYKFPTMKGVIVADCTDEDDIHYFKDSPKVIRKGTEIEVSVFYRNFFGSFLKVKYNGRFCLIKPQNVSFSTE